jgi:nucleoside-diphosphate-sugar epimerase
MKKVLVTGSAGTIGSIVVNGLQGWEVVPFDLPEHDALRLADLDIALVGATHVVHLAWNTRTENFRSRTMDPTNTSITHNVLERSLDHGVRRVILASSVHAGKYPNPGRAHRATTATQGIPDSPYGRHKLVNEALGRNCATRGLEVVAVRFGGVNRYNRQPVQDAERAVWLSHRDCVDVVQKCLDADVVPGNYSCFYAVSDNVGGWHDLSNPFGWTPQDGDRPHKT